jgi:hypothetical protein
MLCSIIDYRILKTRKVIIMYKHKFDQIMFIRK